MTTFEKIAMLVIETADKMNGIQIISRRRLLETKKVVEYLEQLSDVFGGDAIQSHIDAARCALQLSIKLPDIVCQNAGDEFVHELVSLADDVRFSRSKDGDLVASFEIRNIWSN